LSALATGRLEDGRTIVAGLVWSVTPRGVGVAQARLTGRSAKATAFLLRADGRNLALLPPPHLAPQSIALGDVLCQALGPSWCGVFNLEGQNLKGKLVYLAANDGCILPDGDKVYSDERAARGRLREEAHLYTKVYAPAAWAVEGAEDSDAVLRRLDGSKAIAFTPLAASTKVGAYAPLLAGLLAAAVGFAGYEAWPVQRVKAEQAALARKQPPPVDPWRIKARPGQAAAACMAIRRDLAGVSRQGWELAALSCDIGGRTATASLTAFTTDAVLPVLSPPYTAQLSADGASLTITGPLAIAPSDRPTERPSPAAALAARNYLYAHAEGKAPTWQANGGRAQFEISQNVPVSALASGLGRFATASINRLDYTGGTWRVQGDIYD
jgi:hypothetical protein